ncbi:MAG TPA: ABC transporter ATP-binding protein [Candidatus Enterousia avicola]|uniref:ABC transporter ATP-binding protein n=1 Tax=Candidatus Enterousia avicola TaxID=2840787 RepID=A0A9D1MSM5_9PROT|nr:ABC transporter ATP-binding protein [Candidatus Enterousia avicola]
MLKLLRHLTFKEMLLILICLVLIVVQVWLSLTLPDYMALITRLVQTKANAMHDILRAGSMMMLFTVAIFAITFITGFFVAKTSSGLAMRLREKVFKKTLSFSMHGINKFSTSSLITRSTNDINQIQMFFMMALKIGIRAPIMAIWAVIKMYGKSWEWTAVTGVFVVLLLAMIGTIYALTIPKFTIIQKLTDSLNRVTRENLNGIRVVHAYNAEKYQEKKFGRTNDELTKTSLFTHRLMSFAEPGMQFLLMGLVLSIYWVGTYIINSAPDAARLNLFSDMIVFSSYATQVIASFMILTMILLFFSRATVSAKRINEVLESPIDIVDGIINSSDKRKKGCIEFKNVCFRYPDAISDTLHNINFTANAGETVAIIGATGSGKSTLVNLIPRFYDVRTGEVLVDGVNVKDYNQKKLRNKLGYVSQKAIIFRGTVTSNVAYGENGNPKPTKYKIKRAVKIAQAQRFVERMNKKYKAEIAQRGSNLSGGQKQRLSIARSICRDPEIYIFDDSFSALDNKTDLALRKALKKDIKNSTFLIVAQRVGTIINADKILVLDNGKIVAQGKHKDLMKSCQIYIEIAKSQLGKGR